MTRMAVLSDSHGDDLTLRWLLEQLWKRTGQIDGYVHCGDGVRDFERVQAYAADRDPAAFFCSVKGNCDFACDAPLQVLLPVDGHRLMVCHGHLQHVKYDLSYLDDAAAAAGCTVAVYGHTHQPNLEMRQVLLLNPGSVQDGRLALLEIRDDGKPWAKLMAF